MNNEEVGKISYVVEIDTASLKAGTKSVEDAITSSMQKSEKSTNQAGKSVDQFSNKIDALSDGIKPFATASAVASGAVVAGFTSASKAAFEQVRAVENASFGLRAYEKDASSVNAVLGQLIQFARSDKGVLFKREELFQAASTLKGFGEATSNLNERVQVLAKGVSVGQTSFAELSQIIGRSASQGKLTAEAYDQLAYRGIILDASLRGAAVGADQLYAALDGAIDDSILEGRANTIDGLLTRLGSAWRDLGSTILGVDANTSQFIKGGLGDAIMQGIIGITQFIRENKQLIVTIGVAAITFGVLVGGMYLAVQAIGATRAAMVALGVSGAVTQARMLGLVGVISAIAGIIAGNAIQSQLDKTTDGLGDMNVELDDTTKFSGQAADGAKNLSKQLADIDRQAKRVERDFRENLARVIQDHQKGVKDLTKQVEEENVNYNAAVRKRFTEFKEQQGKEEDQHQKKVSRLQTQIDFLRRYDNASNKQKLTELQFILAQENDQFAKRNVERQDKYNADVEAEKISHQKRLKENQTKLNEELAILQKHRNDVKSVRGLALLDEIDMLRRSRSEQLKSLAQQRQDAITSNTGAGSAAGDAFGKNFRDKLQSQMNKVKTSTSTSMKDKDWITQMQNNFAKNWEKNGGNFWKPMQDSFGRAWGLLSGEMEIKNGKIVGKTRGGGGGGWASGGFTGRGATDEVAGAVHRGEYVLPKSLVNQTTGLPDLDKLIGSMQSNSGPSYTINVSGVFATSPNEQRKIADVIVSRIAEKQRAKGIA